MTKKILHLSEYREIDFLNGTLENAVKLLNKLIEKCGKNAKIEFDCSRGYYDCIESDCFIYYKREETDEEYKERLELEEHIEKEKKERKNKQREAKEARDRKEYARLKKKYDK